MFRGFHFPRLNFFDAPKNRKSPFKSEEDLVRWSKYTDAEREKKFKDSAINVLIAISWGAVLLLVWRLIVDWEARKQVTDLLIQNVVGLVYTLIAIAGIKINNQK